MCHALIRKERKREREKKHPPCHLRSVLPLPRGLCPQKTQRPFRSGNQPFSSWITLWRRWEYALINLNSHSKRPGTRGSLRINLNGSFISLTQTQMLPTTTWRTLGCPKTRLCCPIVVPVMLSCSFYRNQNGLIKQQQQKKVSPSPSLPFTWQPR